MASILHLCQQDDAFKKLREAVKAFEVPNLLSDDEKNVGDDAEMVSGAFELGRKGGNLKIKKAGWLYLHEEVLSEITAFLRKLCSLTHFQSVGMSSFDVHIAWMSFSENAGNMSEISGCSPLVTT